MSYYSHWELDFKSLKAVGVLELAKKALNHKVISYKISWQFLCCSFCFVTTPLCWAVYQCMQSKPLNIPFAVLDHEAMSRAFFRRSYEDSIYF